MAKSRIVVLGAGVSGLTTALLLSRESNVSITIVAKFMPGDSDIEYASPWAGANFLPTAISPTADIEEFESRTWPELETLARDHPEAGIHFQDTTRFNRSSPADGHVEIDMSLVRSSWYQNILPDFRMMPKEDLPPGMDSAMSFTSVCINTALYLPWLASSCLKNGVKLRRGVVEHVVDAAGLHHTTQRANVVVNCTGLSSLKLKGVEDKTLYPIRGQIVVVRNDPGTMVDSMGTDVWPDECTYVMNRAAGGGCILGGSYQKGNWESQPDLSLAMRIMQRCIELSPSLTVGKGIDALSIVRHGVGLRPAREGGIRVEKERIGGVWIVHNYGHGGSGYQSSYGCAQKVVKFVNEALADDASKASL